MNVTERILQRITVRGDRDLHKLRPHLAISHILRRVKPHQLHRRFIDILNKIKGENFHKDNFHRFVREMAAKAENL